MEGELDLAERREGGERDVELLVQRARGEQQRPHAHQLQRAVQSPRYGVGIARFTHDPLSVIAASRNDFDDAIRYLSLHDNRYLRFFKGHTDRVVALEMSPKEDSFASAAADDTVRLWDLRTTDCAAAGHDVAAAAPPARVARVAPAEPTRQLQLIGETPH